MSDKLRECPFCGDGVEEPEKIPQEDKSDMFMIQCCNCWLSMTDPTKERLISDWNTRSVLPEEATRTSPEHCGRCEGKITGECVNCEKHHENYHETVEG